MPVTEKQAEAILDLVEDADIDDLTALVDQAEGTVTIQCKVGMDADYWERRINNE